MTTAGGGASTVSSGGAGGGPTTGGTTGQGGTGLTDFCTGVHGTPFVIQVEGQSLFLGAFMTPISSVVFRGPAVMVDKMVAEGFPLQAGYWFAGTDALADPRVIKVLTDAGKWVP